MDQKLSVDVLYYLLTSLSDFESLQAALQVSKRFYNVFKTHPTSIMTAVARDLVGPALPQAIRLVRFHQAMSDPQSPLLREDLEGLETTVADWQDAYLLTKKAEIVNDLEDFFSRRHKDRASAQSTLSDAESHRFRRAMYRFWMYQDRFGSEWRNADPAEQDLAGDDEEFADGTADRTALVQAQKLHLAQFSPAEQRELGDLHLFIASAVDWVHVATHFTPQEALNLNSSNKHESALVTCGPDDILFAMQTRSINHLDDSVARDGFPRQLSGGFVWDALELLNIKEKDQKLPALLDETYRDGDCCARCKTTHERELWRESNWDLLYGIVSPERLVRCLKSNTGRNSQETGPMLTWLQSPRFDFPAMMRWVFDGAGGFSKSDWLCLSCLEYLWTERLFIWWLFVKID
ncbi:hypothetical protein BV25DRAFT_1847363, partial [Artomyces pyxidatus]